MQRGLLLAVILGSQAWLFACPSVAQQSTCHGLPVLTDVARDAPYTRLLEERAHGLPSDTKAVVLGDSVAGRWPSLMVDPLVAAHAVNFAHGGDRFEHTSSMVDQFNAVSARRIERVLVIVGAGGVNRDDPCNLETKARALLAKLKNTFPSARIFVFSIIPKGRTTGAMDDRVRRANATLRRLSTQFGLEYVDIYTPFSDKCDRAKGCPYYGQDGVHPSDKGYELITKAFAKALGRK